MEKTTKVDKQYLANIRHELHEDIFNVISDTETQGLKIIRKPNSSKKQPAPKMIIVVGTDEQAEKLKSKCLNLIERANSNIRNELKDIVLPRYEVRYSMNIIHSESDLVLSINSAQRRKTMNGAEVKQKIVELQKKLSIKQKMENEFFNAEADKYESNIKYIDNCINNINDKKDYTLAEPTGNSYRVTYFDGNCRQQISAGNLLIVVSSAEIKIVDAPSRKKRSDKKDWLYCLGDEYDTLYIYPV